SLPNMQHAIPAYYVIAPAEASSNLSRFDGVRFGYRCADPKDLTDLYKRSRGEGFGAEVQRRILVGAYALSAGYYDAYYLQAQKIRRLIKNDFMAAFAEVDIILGRPRRTRPGKLAPRTATRSLNTWKTSYHHRQPRGPAGPVHAGRLRRRPAGGRATAGAVFPGRPSAQRCAPVSAQH
ncbi:Aspartyl-tRNA(Asn) amidotransferase subunit A (EC 6.3.5.6) @ Glutamyl-tRNA(Gln) amidotransferase subunit A (EC 6.3.5.7), partial [Pseudomonas sp. FEN]